MEEGEYPHDEPDSEHWLEEEGFERNAPAPEGPRGRTSRGWSPPAWLNILLLIAMVALIGVLAYLRDEQPPADSDLAVTAADTSETDSSTDQANPDDLLSPKQMKALLRAASKISGGPQGDKPPWEWATPALAKLLEENGPALDDFTDLTADDLVQWNPTNPAWKKEDMGNDPAWQNILLLKEAEIAYLMRRDEEEAAMRSAVALVKMGSRLENMVAWPSFMHRALEMHRAGAQALAMLLPNTKLSELRLRKFQLEELLPLEPSGKSLARALNGYYQFEKKLIMGSQAGDVPLPPGYMPLRSGWLLFKPNETLRLFAESFRELKDEAGLIQMARVNQIGSRAHQHYSDLKRGVGSPNASGEEYFLTRIQEYAEMLNQHSFARARYNIVMALFAVRRCVLKTGRIPATLDELVPEFLSSSVKDPFTGDGLRYHPDQGIIYSVGLNLKDDGGKPTPFPMADDTEPTARTGIVAARVAR